MTWTLSRRLFLIRTAWGLAGAALAKVAVQLRRPLCRVCGVRAAAHRFRAAGRSGAYCANCGVNVESGQWDLELRGGQAVVSPQVPFPNPRLVRESTKPAVRLTNVRL